MEEEETKLRMAVIAGAAKAVRFKEENPSISEERVIQHISKNVDEIIKKIDNPL